MDKSFSSLSIVVPVYNEEEVIDLFIKECLKIRNNFKEFEIIAVDDGSKDNSFLILKNLVKKNSCLRIIKFAKNSGHMAALDAGLKATSFEWIVTIDADGQDNPLLIPKMLKLAIKTKSEVCFTKRISRKHDGIWHRVFSPIFYRVLNKITGGNAVVQSADFRLMSRKVVVELNKLSESYKVFRVLVPTLGFKSVTFEYERSPRLRGKSKYGFSELFSLGSRSLLASSGAPLRWLSKFALMTTLGAIAVSIATIVIRILSNNPPPGWASLSLLISLLLFFQALFGYIVSEFLLIILSDIRKRPSYQIETIVN